MYLCFFFTISVHLKSGLRRRVAFGGRGLVRREAFGGRGLWWTGPDKKGGFWWERPYRGTLMYV
jgi:hypothetical protein